MILRQLKIRNFKGLESLEIPFTHKKTIIMGKNGTGKTSIFDAYLWLLFGKNSEDAKEFGVKPVGKNGEPKHNVDVEVEGVFEGFTLKRVLKEKWQRKRGSDIPEFVGNETEYYIDGIRVTQSQYNDFIFKLASEKEFKILTVPEYFSKELSWQERRVMISRAINSEAIEAGIRESFGISKDIDIDKAKLQLKQTINTIKNKLAEYPVRISELEGQIVQINEANLNIELAKIDRELERLENQIKAIEKEKENELKAYNENLNKKLQLQKLLSQKISELELENQKKKDDYAKKLREYENSQREITDYQNKISSINLELNDLNNQLEKLRESYKLEQSRIFSLEKTTCDYCGQPLPFEMLSKLKAEGEENFNNEKRKRLELIAKQGSEIKNRIETLKKNLDSFIKAIEGLKIIQKPEEPQLIETTEEIEALKKQIESFEIGEKPEINISDFESKRKEFLNKKTAIQIELSKLDKNKEIQKRISELKAEWQKNAKEQAEAEKELINIEKFEIALSKAIEEKTQFMEGLKFKMFRQLINGTYEPCCEVLYNEVPYSDLNHSAKIIIGVKIIEILQNLLNLSKLPIFIDNAEALNNLPDYEGQMIALFVSIDECLTIKN